MLLNFHPENYVSILAMGNTVDFLVRPTRDLEKIMSRIRGAGVDNDSMRFLDALERADQFFEKQMLDKRLVVFAGGPIYWFQYDITEIAKKLKMKGVAVDVVNFGDKHGPQVG
ncbi:26S proteasome non-ATPase regulatory subunit 4, partial [Tanacetum coccineum]